MLLTHIIERKEKRKNHCLNSHRTHLNLKSRQARTLQTLTQINNQRL
jgi:hypothetical protein